MKLCLVNGKGGKARKTRNMMTKHSENLKGHSLNSITWNTREQAVMRNMSTLLSDTTRGHKVPINVIVISNTAK